MMPKKEIRKSGGVETEGQFGERLKRLEDENGRLRKNIFVQKLIETVSNKSESIIEKASKGYTPYLLSDRPEASTFGSRPGLMAYQTMNRIYDRNSIVRMCVDAKVNMILSLEWGIIPKDRDANMDEETCRKISDIFKMPNSSHEGLVGFARKFLKDLFVLDNATIEKVRDELGFVVELVALDGTTIWPIKDEHGTLIKYLQVVQPSASYYGLQSGMGFPGRRVEFPPDDILNLVQYRSTNRPWGNSPIETLTIEIGADLYAMSYNAMNFVEGDLVNKMVVLGKVGQEALDRAQEFMKIRRGKGHFIPFISEVEGEAKVLDLASSPRDMEFMEFEKWLFRRICAAFQISPNDLFEFTESATRASAEVQERISESKSVRPITNLIQEAFTNEIVGEFSPDYEFRFTPRLSESQKIDIFQKKVAAGWPLNRVLRELGEDPIDFQMDVDGKTINPYDLPNIPVPGVIGLLAGKRTPDEMLEGVYREVVKERKKKLLKVKPVGRERFERETKPALRRLFSKLGRAVVEGIKEKWPPPGPAPEGDAEKQSPIADWVEVVVTGAQGKTEFTKILERAIADEMTRTFLASGRRAHATMGTSFDEDFYDELATDFIRTRFYDKGILFDMADTQLKQLGNQLSKLWREGATLDGYTDAVGHYFAEAKDWQAERIARTEMFNAAAAGTVAGWEEHGIDRFEFISAPDACALCRAITLGGRPADHPGGELISERFRFNDYHGNPYTANEMAKDMPFGDGLPHPNCEDAWAPYVDLDEARETADEMGGRLRQ